VREARRVAARPGPVLSGCPAPVERDEAAASRGLGVRCGGAVARLAVVAEKWSRACDRDSQPSKASACSRRDTTTHRPKAFGSGVPREYGSRVPERGWGVPIPRSLPPNHSALTSTQRSFIQSAAAAAASVINWHGEAVGRDHHSRWRPHLASRCGVGGVVPFGDLDLPKLLLVLGIALVFLGPKRLPEAGNALGRGIREFKDAITGKADSTPNGPSPPQSQPYRPPPSYRPPGDATPPST
jgi:TatA/E family protein of Tat protein translocase